MKRIVSLLMCIVFAAAPAMAQSSLESEFAAMKSQMEQMQKKMAQMEERLMKQDKQLAAQATHKDEHEGHDHEEDHEKEPLWVPEIGVVVDSLFTLDSPKTDGEGADVFSIRELELLLGSKLDQYSRLDAILAFSTDEDEAVSLEEAYLTRSNLPFNATARIGKFKPQVGKTLTMPLHGLDTVDQPLVIQRYFTPEGMNKTGVDLSKNFDSPVPGEQQISVGILEGGDEEAAFGGTKRRPSLYGHLKNQVDITEKTGFELGGSYMTGSRDEDANMEVQILAADATLTHQLNANQRIKFQAEAFGLSRKESIDETTLEDLDGNTWGAYGLVDFRVNPSWSIGTRYDFVQPIAIEAPLEGAHKQEKAYTGYLTFYQSEFARWRAQLTHTEMTTGKDNNGVYLQGTFVIGTHKHNAQ